MAKIPFIGLHVFILLFMILSFALSGVVALPTSDENAEIDSANVINTTDLVSLLSSGGTADNLPDDGQGPSPAGSHKPGGPYDYGQYCKSSSWYYCGNSATGDRGDVHIGEQELMNDVWYNSCWAPAKGCLRIFCYETSAIYLCNDNDHEIQISCYNVGYLASRIREACCPSAWVSGQMFHPTDNYNVVVGYGDCKNGIGVGPLASGLGNNYGCNIQAEFDGGNEQA